MKGSTTAEYCGGGVWGVSVSLFSSEVDERVLRGDNLDATLATLFVQLELLADSAEKTDADVARRKFLKLRGR